RYCSVSFMRAPAPRSTLFPYTTLFRSIAYSLSEPDVDVAAARNKIPAAYLRTQPAELPELSELDVVRHYSRLSQMNYGVDTHFYPLGSCTMKYNPKINEDMARVAGFGRLHPLAPEAASQGALQ